MSLREFSVRLRATGIDPRSRRPCDFHFIVPVRAGTPERAGDYATRFVEDFYRRAQVAVTDVLVRYKGRALPTWCEKAKRVTEAQTWLWAR